MQKSGTYFQVLSRVSYLQNYPKKEKWNFIISFSFELVSSYLRGTQSMIGVMLERGKGKKEHWIRQSNMFPIAHFLILSILIEQAWKQKQWGYAWTALHTYTYLFIHRNVCINIHIYQYLHIHVPIYMFVSIYVSSNKCSVRRRN